MKPTLLTPSGGLGCWTVRDMLTCVGVTVDIAVVEAWTELERAVAYDWAVREQEQSIGNRLVKSRPKPWLVTEAEKIPPVPSSAEVNTALDRHAQAGRIRDWEDTQDGWIVTTRAGTGLRGTVRLHTLRDADLFCAGLASAEAATR